MNDDILNPSAGLKGPISLAPSSLTNCPQGSPNSQGTSSWEIFLCFTNKWEKSLAILFFVEPEISHTLGKCSTHLPPDMFPDNLKDNYVYVREPECMYLYHVGISLLTSEEGTGSFGTRVISSCKPLGGCWDLNLGPL